jgi:hypothetical protein
LGVKLAYHQISAVILKAIKWPVAIFFLFWLPALADVLIKTITSHVASMEWFFYGALAFSVLWLMFFRRRGWFVTLEHELTHCVFAIILGNRVTNLTAGVDGGKMTFTGTDNWLLTIAPYFFPTFTIGLLGLSHLGSTPFSDELLFLFGFTLAYHILSTFAETSFQQPDLQQVGLLFSSIFLPGANLASYNVVLVVTLHGWGGLPEFDRPISYDNS